MYRFLYRHFLSHIDPELIHDLTLDGLRSISSFLPVRSLMSRALAPDMSGLSISSLGLDFAHPLGLAAGFDKDARGLRAMRALGFSFVEVGTVTPRPQPGNPRKRIFRLIEDEALINRMGFPSAGMDAIERNLQGLRESLGPIGVSLGKNKDTALPNAHRDYGAVLSRLYPHADFFVVNISSPNTPGLRQLQTREYLVELLAHLHESLQTLAGDHEPKPLLLKLSPDMAFDEIDTALDLALQYSLRGIVATNTTTARSGLRSPRQSESGGLSGRPLRARSSEIIRYVYQRTQGKLCIVGVGGIFSGADIWEKMRAGATLVQAYTGLIYEGPLFVKRALRELQQKMRQEGIGSLAEIVGADHPAR